MTVSITITEYITGVETVSSTSVVNINNLAIPTLDASDIVFDAYGSITATTVEAALQQLADQGFRSADTPTGDNIDQGDFWYETDTETLYLYREVSSNVYNWVPIALGTGDSDTLDGGSY